MRVKNSKKIRIKNTLVFEKKANELGSVNTRFSSGNGYGIDPFEGVSTLVF
jgi:hypothetical protein